ncbi:MAG: ABC transporter ATP-binding protein, partial [Flavobacterium sp.]|nr:ABC transporter ATP-binding protein [Flavobacterium sp.]
MRPEQTENLTKSFSHKKNGEAVIEINNLKKSFGKLDVLKDFSLKLFKGENLVVLGKSGTGKSV